MKTYNKYKFIMPQLIEYKPKFFSCISHSNIPGTVSYTHLKYPAEGYIMQRRKSATLHYFLELY